jgi:(p)ppGpp synthase/HD superfamily hydrolase
MPTEADVTRARRFALKAHGNQKYGDEFPYIVHVMWAESILIRFGITDPDLRIIVLLHDVLEDTEVEYEEMETFFPTAVASVAALSEPKGMSRKMRHAVAYPKIANDARALVAKLCDRISHLEFGGKKIGMYVKEHGAFKDALYGPFLYHMKFGPILTKLWSHLDDLIVEAKVTP